MSLPLATGGNTLCTLGVSQSWPLTGQSDSHVLLCTTFHGLWSLGYLLLWGYACWRTKAGEGPDQPRIPLKQAGQLLVLVSSGSTLFLYTLFQAAALTPWASSRYLVGLLMSLPSLLAPLWQGASRPGRPALALSSIHSAAWGQIVRGLATRLTLALPLLAWLIGIVTLLWQAPGVATINKQQQALIDHLLAQGTTYLYSDYWDCNRIVFQSNEHLICAMLDSGLQRGLNRYQPYWVQGSRASQPASLCLPRQLAPGPPAAGFAEERLPYLPQLSAGTPPRLRYLYGQQLAAGATRLLLCPHRRNRWSGDGVS